MTNPFVEALERAEKLLAEKNAEIEHLKEGWATAFNIGVSEQEQNKKLRADIERLYATLGRRRVALANAETEIERLTVIGLELLAVAEQLSPAHHSLARAQIDKAKAALTKKPRDLTVARVDEHGVAYNSAGESIGMTGKTGHGCSGAVGEPERTEEEKPMNRKASMTTLDEARAKVIAIMEPKQPWEKLDPDLIEFGAKLLIAYERLAAETRAEPKP